MKILISIIALLLFIELKGQPVNSMLSKQIDSMAFEDQKWRKAIIGQENATSMADSLSKKMDETDSINYIAVKHIYEVYGYPGIKMVGKQSSQNFWMLLQHATHHSDFLASAVVKLKEEADKGNASITDYAYLIDAST